MNKKFLISLACTFSAILIAGTTFAAAGYRVNVSSSLPLGIYKTSSKPVKVGELVQLCPPDRQPFIEAMQRGYIGPGKCRGGFSYLFKKVLAGPSDLVAMSDKGMSINGKLLPYSAPLKRDNIMRPLPIWRSMGRTLLPNELILMTDSNPKSFDSRYFGPVETTQIISVVIPVFTWDAQS